MENVKNNETVSIVEAVDKFLGANDKKEDVVREPSHYQQGTFEVIDEMLIVFGPQKTFDFCVMNAWKYRARAPFKEKMEQDMEKSHRYLEMAKQIADAYQDESYGLDIPHIHLIKGE